MSRQGSASGRNSTGRPGVASGGSRAGLREVLSDRGLAPNKRFGQNFLTDEGILDRIVEAAEIGETDTVLEIGPGAGALTERLAARARRVVAVEIDRGFAELLQEKYKDDPHVTILCADILKTDTEALFQEEVANACEASGIPDAPCAAEAGASVRVVANLPYYITTPILLSLLPKERLFSRFVIMLQREVADRMTAGPGSKDYSALSLIVQYYTAPSLVTIVPPSAFYPQPEVTSAVLRLDRLPAPPVTVQDPDRMFALIRAAFGKRRKTLANAVSTAGLGISSDAVRRALQEAGLSESIRGEALSLAEFAAIAEKLA